MIQPRPQRAGLKRTLQTRTLNVMSNVLQKGSWLANDASHETKTDGRSSGPDILRVLNSANVGRDKGI